mmetsp:Transcript_69962/g.167941  ORF Transcript_69962/g.167941 Transcript_69962/m.167941 type:complete len:385 (+) Transcript_69962:70-1224(+)
MVVERLRRRAGSLAVDVPAHQEELKDVLDKHREKLEQSGEVTMYVNSPRKSAGRRMSVPGSVPGTAVECHRTDWGKAYPAIALPCYDTNLTPRLAALSMEQGGRPSEELRRILSTRRSKTEPLEAFMHDDDVSVETAVCRSANTFQNLEVQSVALSEDHTDYQSVSAEGDDYSEDFEQEWQDTVGRELEEEMQADAPVKAPPPCFLGAVQAVGSFMLKRAKEAEVVPTKVPEEIEIEVADLLDDLAVKPQPVQFGLQKELRFNIAQSVPEEPQKKVLEERKEAPKENDKLVGSGCVQSQGATLRKGIKSTFHQASKATTKSLPEDMYEHVVKHGLPTMMQERVETRAYYMFANSGSDDAVKNYYDALRIELDASRKRGARGWGP